MFLGFQLAEAHPIMMFTLEQMVAFMPRVAHKLGKHHDSLTLSHWGDFYHNKKTNHKMFQVRGADSCSPRAWELSSKETSLGRRVRVLSKRITRHTHPLLLDCSIVRGLPPFYFTRTSNYCLWDERAVVLDTELSHWFPCTSASPQCSFWCQK